MGSYFSRNESTQTTSRDDRLAFIRLLLNFVTLGMILGFLIHNHDLNLWNSFRHHHHSLLWVLKCLFFLWYAFVWVIAYSAAYLILLRPFFCAILAHFVGISHALPSELFIQVMFGLWGSGQIVGGWLDGETPDCFIHSTCRSSYMMMLVWNILESSCEYFFGYEWDGRRDAYFHVEDNVCSEIFIFAPRFTIALLGSFFSYIALTLLSGP